MADIVAAPHHSGANGTSPPPESAADTVRVLSRGLQDVLRDSPSMPTRVSLRFGGATLDVEWAVAGVAAPPPTAAVPHSTGSEPAGPAGTEIRAPLLGTFYAAPEPYADPFVAVGDVVEAGQQVAIIEAMKLMNAIVAESAGEVVEILVADGQPVEYDQPLMVIRPVAS